MSKAKYERPNTVDWLGDLSSLQEIAKPRRHDLKEGESIPLPADLKLSDLLNETPTEALADKPEATAGAPAPAPIKTVSDFTADMLAAARDLYLDEDLRREVAKRIS